MIETELEVKIRWLTIICRAYYADIRRGVKPKYSMLECNKMPELGVGAQKFKRIKDSEYKRDLRHDHAPCYNPHNL